MSARPHIRAAWPLVAAVLAAAPIAVLGGAGPAWAATPPSVGVPAPSVHTVGTEPAGAGRAGDSLMSGGRASANSLNWAGYAVTGSSITSVSGSWVQPAASCSGKKATQSAFWVGIDGYAPNDPTVQQIGTDADCSKGTKKVPSSPSYYAWYELYPSALVPLTTPGHPYPVAPGDVLTGSVSESGASVTVSLADAGHWSYSTTTTVTTVPLGASAEWIAEAPCSVTSTTCKPVGLADFGSVAFTGASADGLPVDSTSFAQHQVTMTKNKKGTIVKASTSVLTGGTAFTVDWVSS